MGKILRSWSGMRKYLEQEMLADSLHGRIRYNCTTYICMDGCHIFEVYIDNKLVKQFSWETVNTYFVENEYKKNSNHFGIGEYWDEFWALVDSVPMQARQEYTDNEFCKSLENYRNQSIQDSIQSENPLEKMFAVLDRRVGKRRLGKLKETMEEQSEWLQQFYRLRLNAENYEELEADCTVAAVGNKNMTSVILAASVASNCLAFSIAISPVNKLKDLYSEYDQKRYKMYDFRIVNGVLTPYIKMPFNFWNTDECWAVSSIGIGPSINGIQMENGLKQFLKSFTYKMEDCKIYHSRIPLRY